MTEKILIIDDEKSIRTLLKKILERAGYECAQANDAAEARVCLQEQDYSLLLCDIVMPNESGMDFIRDEMAVHEDRAVIMVTAVNDPTTAKQALDMGVYGYVIKPFEPNEILIAVQNALRRRSLEIENRQHLEKLEEKVQERTIELQENVKRLTKLQEELQESEEKYRTAIEHSNDGVCILRGRKFLYTNRKFLEIFGYKKFDALVGKPLTAVIHPDDSDRVRSINEKRMKGESVPDCYEYTGIRKNGDTVHIDVSVAMTTFQGKPANLSFHRDITDRFTAQEELRESEERIKTIMNSVHTGIVLIEPEKHEIVDVNDSAAKMIGVPSEYIIGKVCHEYICPAERGKCPITDLGQRVDNSERILIRDNGESIPVLKSVRPVIIKGREYLLESFIDISSLKEAEKKIRKSHSELEGLISAIPSILIGISDSGLIEKWNKVAEDTFGLKANDVLGRHFSESSIKCEWDRLEKIILKCREECRVTREDDFPFIRPDGKDGFLGLTINPILCEHGKEASVLLMGADITKRKIMESQLSQAQKLESIGQLAAGIAHEINTPIQYIGDNTRFLQEAFTELNVVLESYEQLLLDAVKEGSPTDNAVQEAKRRIEDVDIEYLSKEIPAAVQQTLDGVEHVSNIVRSMKEFSHPGVSEKTAIDINKALESTITISRNEWKYVAEMETDLDISLPLVNCLPGELNQVFLNMIINAAHAISEVVGDGSTGKGTIKIGTRSKDDLVEISISDTGCGIPEKIRSRIFDPFFTTKEAGKGTGQGLAISHSVIVEKHGGQIDFQANEEGGTTFYINLPVNNNVG